MFPRLATRSALLACAVLALLGAIVIAGWLVPRLALVHVLPPNSPLLIDLVLLVSSLVAAALVSLVLFSARSVHERFLRADEASRDLARSEERYAATQRGSFQGLWDWDIQAGRVEYAPHCKTLLGYGTDEPVCDLGAWTGRIHPDDRERVTAAIDNHLLHRAPLDQEFRLAGNLAPPRWVRARGQAVWNEHGIPMRMAGSLADISDRRRLEDELKATAELLAADRRAQAALAEASAAATLRHRELAACASHRIRSSLADVARCADSLLEQDRSGNAAEALRRIKEHSERLLKAIDAVIELAQTQTGNPDFDKHLAARIRDLCDERGPLSEALSAGHSAAFATVPGRQQTPLATPPSRTNGETACASAREKKPPLAGRRILVAEDSPDNQWLVTQQLQKNGAIVEVVADGLAAIDKAHAAWKGGRAFDAVLMDVQMPVLDGFEATRRLRTQGYVFPILALTAQAQNGERKKCLAAGCDDYLPKPVRVPQLLAMLTACLAKLDAAGRDTQLAEIGQAQA